MRPLWIVALVVAALLAVASVASASVRDEVRSLVDAAATLTDAGDEVVPDPVPSDPAPETDGDGEAEEGGEADTTAAEDDQDCQDPSGDGERTTTRKHEGPGYTKRVGEKQNHGAYVSAVARQKAETGNHGATVSAMAKSQTGKPDKSAE